MRGIRLLAACATLALLGVAGAQTTPPGAGAPAAGATEAATAAAPPARQFQNALIAYAVFQRDISELAAATIESEASLDEALERVARHNGEALVRGWTTYGADVVAQSPAFVGGARELAGRIGREAAINAMAGDRTKARELSGAQEAEALSLRALAADAARVAEAADLFDGYARTLQHRPWASAEASGQEDRVRRLRALVGAGGFAPMLPMSLAPRLTIAPLSVRASEGAAGFGGAGFWDALFGDVSRRARAPAIAVNFTQSAAGERSRAARDGMLSLAALQALAAGQTPAAELYARDASAVACVEMARLQFYQCLSSVRFVNENAYCAARHGLRDIAVCMSPSLSSASPAREIAIGSAVVELPQVAAPLEAAPSAAEAALEGVADAAEVVEVAAPLQPSAASAGDDAAFRASLGGLGAGELFARADELEEQGAAAQARMARRALIARFPDSPLALVAARQLTAQAGER